MDTKTDFIIAGMAVMPWAFIGTYIGDLAMTIGLLTQMIGVAALFVRRHIDNVSPRW